MAADMKISAGAAHAALDALVDSLDGTAAKRCHVRIYSGSVPASAAAALSTMTNVELADIHFPNPAFGNAGASTTGSVTANSSSQSETSAVSGTAAFFRVYTDASATTGAAIIQGTCGATIGQSDMVMNTTAIATGATVTITSWKISLSLG